MFKGYKIIKKIRDCKIWPGEPAVEFEGCIIYKDKKGKDVLSDPVKLTVSLATYKLIEYFQTHGCSKELADLIEDYGDERFSAGIDNEATSRDDY